jgi:phytoene synthase
LKQINYTREEFDKYIYGSADVVGLMCLKVFVNGDQDEYERLKQPAMKLGSAFQKVNFLRDMKSDFEILNRKYFPQIDLNNFSESGKETIIAEIESDFQEAYKGILELPPSIRISVETAYHYYRFLLQKIKRAKARDLLQKRQSVSSLVKVIILASLYFKKKLLYK